MPDDEPPRNPFVRWKQNVDNHIAFTFNGILGIPSIVSQSFSLRQSGEQKVPTATSTSQTHMPHPSDGTPSQSRLEVPVGVLPSDIQLRQFEEWFHNSPYSPEKLQQLPPPVPRGVPNGIAAESFTFSDAFDDLLLASTGRPMRDLTLRALLNEDRMQATFNPYPSWSEWSGRAGISLGLLDGYFPHRYWTPYPSWKPYKTQAQVEQGGTDEWKRYDGNEQYYENDWKQEAAQAYRRDPTSPGGLFYELERLPRDAGLFQKKESSSGTSNSQDDKGSTSQTQASEAETEDELYSFVKSALTEPEKTFGAFIRSIADVKVGGEATASFSKSKTDDTRNVVSEDGEGLRTVRSTEEHIDWFGSKHIKTVIRTLNANGDEIARETHYTIRGGSQPRRKGEETDREAADRPRQLPKIQEKQAETTKEPKSNGWFWR